MGADTPAGSRRAGHEFTTVQSSPSPSPEASWFTSLPFRATSKRGAHTHQRVCLQCPGLAAELPYLASELQ